MAGGQCPGLQFHSPAFPKSTNVTVDEWERRVPSVVTALHAPMARCGALHHCRGHRTRWLPRV